MKLQLVILCVAGLAVQTAVAQEAGVRIIDPATIRGSDFTVNGSPLFARQQASRKEMNEAVKVYKNAEGDQEQEQAMQQLREALENQYDRLLEDYENHLDEMEKKIQRLREQLGKRRDARRELVDLRLQMLIKEADGLGWPDERPSAFFGGRFGGTAAFPSNFGGPSGFSGGGKSGQATSGSRGAETTGTSSKGGR